MLGVWLLLAALPARAQSPDLSVVLERAGRAVAAIEAGASLVVADEVLAQTADLQNRMGGSNFSGAGERGVGGTGIMEYNTRRVKRQSRSQVLMWFRPSNPPAWGTARQVLEIDGEAVPPPPKPFEDVAREGVRALAAQWNAWSEAGRKVHLGEQVRDVASPLFALMLLRDAVRPGVEFKKGGEETVGGVRAWKVTFTEKVVTVSRLEGLPASPLHGTFWIDPAEGRVLRTRLEAGDKQSIFQVRTEVDYRMDAALGLMMPSELRERYDAPEGKVEGKASYANYRRVALP